MFLGQKVGSNEPIELGDFKNSVFLGFHITGSSKKLVPVPYKQVQQPKDFSALSFYNTRVTNLMMKLAQGLISNNQCLQARVLWSKYKVDLSANVASLRKAGCSNLWHCICSIWDIMKYNVSWTLGTGVTVKFWTNPWLPNRTSLLTHTFTCIPNYMLYEPISHYVDSHRQWNW